MLEKAIRLSKMGFHVFPLNPDSKLPHIADFPKLATRDVEQLRRWWMDPVLEIEQPYNIGISTSHFGEDEALLVVDVDNKNEKTGDEEILRLEMQGFDFPKTKIQVTPTNGKHLIYKVKTALKQGSNVLAKGLDIRSRGGYIVGAGSTLNGKEYKIYAEEITEAPGWIIEKCQEAVSRDAANAREEAANVTSIDKHRAIARATEYLKSAPPALQGEGGDHTTFAVACMVRDFGVSKDDCLGLLDDHWNGRCDPPWSIDELRAKVDNAYQYAHDKPGTKSPELDFQEETKEGAHQAGPKGEHPFDKINKEYAFVTAGGSHHILHETKDPEGREYLDHLNELTFHKKFASNTMFVDGKMKPVTELWMRHPKRRSYNGMCFRPELDAPPGWYNLWRGFAYSPLPKDEKPTPEMVQSVNAFTAHAFENVCDGDPALFDWLMGYFAHLIQRPWEKPLVALVFRGLKGTGKNALVERVGALLGNHFLVTGDRRYLTGNFNGHFENNLFFVLDEAFWSGDKQAEGVLKNLITGTKHLIEPKGRASYTVENCTRVAIIGNEEWLVPATQDERRFAVFNVGARKRGDQKFFQTMRVQMEQGGYRYLLRYLMDFDLSKVNVNRAPSTEGLFDQKMASLTPFDQFWYECLNSGRILNTDTDWPSDLLKETLRNSFQSYFDSRNIRGRFPTETSIGKHLKNLIPSVKSIRISTGERHWYYVLPNLQIARKNWEDYIGHTVSWDDMTDIPQ